MQLTNVLLAPVVTEKSSIAQQQGKYTFRVHSDASKVEVEKAVRKAYGVDVVKVNMMKVLKKERLAGRGRTITKRHASKRAIVTLKAKQTIDFNKVKTSK